MAYVDSAFYPNPVQPYTLLRDYSSFMRDYTGYIDDILPPSNPNVNLTPQELERIYSEFNAKGKIKLTQEEKMHYAISVYIRIRLMNCKHPRQTRWK